MNQIFEIEYHGCDAQGRAVPGVRRYPAFSCGHCSTTVVMNPARQRERVTCKKCGRWICEQSELCNSDCTPLYSIVEDRAWTEQTKWTRLLPGIMSGVDKLDDAKKLGLIKE